MLTNSPLEWAEPGLDPRNAFAGCSGRAQRYRRILDIENHWTPGEMRALWEHRAEFHEELRRQIEKIMLMLQAEGRGLRAFTRINLSDEVTLYRDAAPEPDGGRRLFLCFCGNVGRMMLPASVFLNHLPDDPCEVVLLRDPSMMNFLRGVRGFAASPAELVARLSKEFPIDRYRDVSVIGTSAGGAAAVYFATLLGAARGLSIGGHHPTKAKPVIAGQGLADTPSGLEFDELLTSAAPGCQPVLGAAFGKEFEEDRKGAESLQARFQRCTLIAIEGLADHGALPYLLKNRQLANFMRRFLPLVAAPRNGA